MEERILDKNDMEESDFDKIKLNNRIQPSTSVSNVTSNSFIVYDGSPENTQPNIFKRILNALAPGKLYGSMFSLTLITLGSASLTFPQKYEQMSLLAGMIGTILGALITYWTLNLLIISGLKHNMFNYSRLLKKLYGHGCGIMLDVVIIIYTLGVMILYLVICIIKC